MNKELTPLEWLNYYKKKLYASHRSFRDEGFDIIEKELKRIDYLERVNKDLSDSKNKLIEERNNKIIEHRIVYDNYNFQNIKKFVACKNCQYYENEKCMNKNDCFWLELERKLKTSDIIKEKDVNVYWLKKSPNLSRYNLAVGTNQALKKDEYNLLKEVFK